MQSRIREIILSEVYKLTGAVNDIIVSNMNRDWSFTVERKIRAEVDALLRKSLTIFAYPMVEFRLTMQDGGVLEVGFKVGGK